MQGGGIGLYAFGGAYLLQPLNDGWRRDAPEVEPLTTGYDGAGETMGLGGGQNEYDVRGRLLKGFEEGVGGCVGEHVGFVQDVHLVFAFGGGEDDLFLDTAYLIYATVAGGVYLNEVQCSSLVDGDAEVA